jgi:proton-translocating NADH-quinone oxidoreductase chain L
MLLFIIFCPLIGSMIAALTANQITSRIAAIFTTIIMFQNVIFCFILAPTIYIQENVLLINIGSWINSGLFSVDWAFQCDKLTMSMLFVVNIISALVHLYSTEYMEYDPHLARFMSYLSLFTFFMLILITGDNFIMTFLGWEGVGLCSYLLISFWYTRIQANKAAIKALVVNRISDFGFTIGIITIFFTFQTVDFSAVFALAPAFIDKTINFLGYNMNVLTLICVLLFVGAMGKSAQIGLHTWLPDAMEGPTPVSALIHAATMVTAGVFLVIKCSPLFEYVPNVLAFITLIGALTAFFSATTGLVQSDIKKVIAYSTCSQLGYMFFICGLSGYHFSLLHLINHAFFKALLFLSAGAIIHSMSNEQDMRRYGGLIKLLPFTYIMLLIGSLSLMGFPFLTGYYSKDLILEFAFTRYTLTSTIAYWLGVLTAMFTSFYSFRVLFLTFLVRPNGFKRAMWNVHEVPGKMAFALIILSFGSIFLGFFLKDIFLTSTGINYVFWEKSIFVLSQTNFALEAQFIPMSIKVLPLLFSLFGVWCVYFLNSRYFRMVLRVTRRKIMKSKRLGKLVTIFSFFSNKWYFDVIYNKLINYNILHFSYEVTFKLIDKGILEVFGPFGMYNALTFVSEQLRRLQSGLVYHYAIFILFVFAFMIISFEHLLIQ